MTMQDLPINQILHGDCLEEMRKLPSNSIDLVVTSPPYNLGNRTRNGKNYTEKCSSGRTSSLWASSKLHTGYETHEDSLPRSEYIQWQKTLLLECWRLLGNAGAIFYVHKPRIQDGSVQTPLELIPEQLVNNLRQVIIWNRGSGFNTNHRHFVSKCEWILLLAKPDFSLIGTEVSGYGDVWDLLPDRTDNPHPAPFPLSLARRAISCTDAEIVLDPFMGSGTTAVAAHKEGRKYIGIEIAANYIEYALGRIADAKVNQELSFR
jgi:site-specific DNA-methyltransferase (adenine-specific)